MILGCKGLTHRSDENMGFEEMTAFLLEVFALRLYANNNPPYPHKNCLLTASSFPFKMKFKQTPQSQLNSQ